MAERVTLALYRAQDFFFRGSFQQLVSSTLNVQAWDWDRMSFNDSLGNGSIDLRMLTNLHSGQPIECSVQLKDQQAVPGEVFFVLQWQGDGGATAPAVQPPHQPYGQRTLFPPNTPHGQHEGPTGYQHGSYGGYGAAPYDGPHSGSQVTQRIAATFAHFDTNRSGYLDYAELRGALMHYGITSVTLQEAASVVRRYDDHPDGKLELAEFAELVKDLESGVLRKEGVRTPHNPSTQVPARVSAAFDAFDTNRSGMMDYRELRTALRYYGVDTSEGEAAAIVRAYDDNPDGKLDRVEFANLVRDLEGGHLRKEGRAASHGRYPGGTRRPDRDPRYDPYSSGRGCGEGLRMGEGLGRAGAYLMDVAFRTLCFASVTALIVAPDRLRADADVAAQAVGGDSAERLISSVPQAFYFGLLGVLALLLLAWLDLCGFRRICDKILVCAPCASCWRCWVSCLRSCVAGRSQYRDGYDERYGGRYSDPYDVERGPGYGRGPPSRDGRYPRNSYQSSLY
jgi:Ca2+-binding EF-hand superfamily protein